MAVSKLICPECDTVLRPAKPLAAGKKVKCPKCGITFAARDEEESEPPPVKKGAIKKKAEPAEKKTGMEYETTTYGVIKEKEDEAQEEKEERGDDLVAEYLKVNKSKDPRGPAQEAVMKPTNWLIITGTCGAVGYGLFLLALIILYCMPVKDPTEQEEGAKKKKLKGLAIGPTVSVIGDVVDPLKAEKEEAAKKLAEGAAAVFIAAVLAFIQNMHWILFFTFCFLLLLCIAYCSVVIYGAVKAQGMESRTWGIVSSIVAMVPFNGLGFMAITGTLAYLLIGFLYSDTFVINSIIIAVLVIEAAWGVSIGIWNIKTLMDPAVIEGFDYIEEED